MRNDFPRPGDLTGGGCAATIHNVGCNAIQACLNTNNQVLIYPVYNSNNTSHGLDIGLAANEFMFFMQSLVAGVTVQDALSQMNTQTQTDISQHALPSNQRWSWTYYGNSNLTFTAP